MELKFDKNKIKGVVENYYREYEDFDGRVTIGCKLGSVGYGITEHQDAIVLINITGSMDVLGVSVPMIREVNDEELVDIFRVMLDKEGYTLSDFTINSGVEESVEGYGVCERTVKRPYFRGVVVRTKEKILAR